MSERCQWLLFVFVACVAAPVGLYYFNTLMFWLLFA